ncbi:MAG: hypothetical protein MJZ34_02750 [Paludibacteraceae bacterium]|nr:hypothetical protein [Paludibacteraceae bacterium]
MNNAALVFYAKKYFANQARREQSAQEKTPDSIQLFLKDVGGSQKAKPLFDELVSSGKDCIKAYKNNASEKEKTDATTKVLLAIYRIDEARRNQGDSKLSYKNSQYTTRSLLEKAYPDLMKRLQMLLKSAPMQKIFDNINEDLEFSLNLSSVESTLDSVFFVPEGTTYDEIKNKEQEKIKQLAEKFMNKEQDFKKNMEDSMASKVKGSSVTKVANNSPDKRIS